MADAADAAGAPRRVLVIGDANVDLVVRVPARGPDGRREVAEPLLAPGGTAANTARALAALGVPVAFAGAVGDDAFGRQAVADLTRFGVDTGPVVVTREDATCQVIAVLEPDGERSLIVWPTDGGALRRLRPGDVPAPLVAGASWLHTSAMCLRDAPSRDALLEAMATARAAGVPVSIDLNLRLELWGMGDGRRAVVERALGLADVVLGSGPEEIAPLARAIGTADLGPAAGPAGTAADDAADGGESAAAALAGGARTVVARLGPGGALACAPDGSVTRSPGFSVPVTNVVGAGDAFNAGFVAAMVEGRGLAEALRWGNAVAAGKVARAPDAPDLPSRAEVEALLG